MSMEIVYVRTYVRTCVRAYVRPRPTARLRMREIGIPHISKCLRPSTSSFLTRDLNISCGRGHVILYSASEMLDIVGRA